MMDARTLLTRLAQARSTLLAELDGVAGDELTQGEVTPGRNGKDVLAHIAAWDREVLAGFEALLYDTQPYRVAMTSFEAWDERMTAQRRSLPLAQVMMDFHMVRREIENLVEMCHPEMLEDDLQYPWDERGTLARLLTENCAEHDERHAAEFRAWRERRTAEVS